MPTPGDKFGKEMADRFTEHGVTDYILMFRDPDSDSDWFESAGSRFWRMGACMDMIEQTKRRRALEEDGEEEEVP